MHAPLNNLPAAMPPQRSNARRERKSDTARTPVLHVVAPGVEVGRAFPRRRETVVSFLRRTGWAKCDPQYGWQFRKGLPTTLEINGEYVLRKDWHKARFRGADVARFVSYPLGGVGKAAKQVVGLVALVAVAAFASWAGPLLATSLGFTGGAATFAGGLITGAIGLGGALLINALTAPKPGATNAPDSTQDQIYSIQAQGNAAKLGQPLPVWYGRLKRFPEFAATPWGEFVGNDQYLNLVLSMGMGTFDYEKLYVDDTILWDSTNGLSSSFSSAQVAFYEPGQTISLFPTNVASSAEVTGQQLPDGSGTFGGQYYGGGTQSPGAWVGGYVANPSGTETMALAIDFVLPAGCFTIDTQNNNIGSANVNITAEYCPVNDAGAPTAGYSVLFSVQRSYGSTSPIRDSIKVNVAPGRYMVRFRRNDGALTAKNGANTVVWAGLRSFLVGEASFPDVSTVAIRIKASETTQGSYKFGVLATRKVPVWNGSTFVTQASRNAGWAFLDAVTNAQYGSGLPISKSDFNAIVSFAAGCDARGDTFDYCFSTAVAVPEAWDKILTSARARHFWLGDTVSVVRDEWRDVPSMLLTDREIVRDSTNVTLTMLGDEDPDAVIVEYIDQDTWLPAQVQYPPDSELFTAVNAEVKRIDGVTKRAQAYRECAFYYLQSIYRRENVSIGTEYEGRAITFGQAIRVQSELPMAYGYGGAVVDRSANVLTLNPAPSWADAGTKYIRLRRPNGKWFGPIRATRGAYDAAAQLNTSDLSSVETAQSVTLADVLARADGGEYPSYEFGTADNQSRVCVVLNGTPNGSHCTLNLVVDDPRVHATDIGVAPSLPTSQFPSNGNVPLVVGLNASFGQGTAEPILSASWFPAAGALYYRADVSYDGGNSWAQVYEGQDNKLSSVVTLAALKLRVQAVGAVVGPYTSVDLTAPTIEVASGAVVLKSLADGLREQVTTVQNQLNDKIDQALQLIASISANQDSRNWLDKKQIRSQLHATAGNASAEIADIKTVLAGSEAAFAEYKATISASYGSTAAEISTISSAVATLDGYAAASYGVKLDVNGYATGFQLVNAGSPASSSCTFTVDTFKIAAPSYSISPVNILTVTTVGGAPKVAINGDLLVAGSLSAISANFGNAVMAGTISSQNGKMVHDYTNNRDLYYD